VEVFRARVVDVNPNSLIVEITGTEDKIDGLVEVLQPYGVLEMARTGRIAMTRNGGAAPRRDKTVVERVEDDEALSSSV
jgi:acetolactate synthase-1/3 small subunit